ncbi:helix-turn-helix domain-containing protein [Georgenia sp. EYE_87]|uniref:helix-turn-helix domain-containing protein n=1 Tax=Georgenia sp. EYE_87 TaxID=2853448 RepID=UPI0035A92975|nr:helix-turn-helix domain-containing protein [Georgenia sp. EYE_87]
MIPQRRDGGELEDREAERALVLPLFRFYTLAEAAGLLGISKARAYGLVHSGTLPAEQVGPHRQWCVDAGDLIALLRSTPKR